MARPSGSILDKRIVRVAVEPALPRLGRRDHWMLAAARVLGGVAVRRVVAASGRAALLAGPQMNPGGARLDALFALSFRGLSDRLDGADVSAGSGRGRRRHGLDQPPIRSGPCARRRRRSILRPPPTPRV